MLTVKIVGAVIHQSLHKLAVKSNFLRVTFKSAEQIGLAGCGKLWG